MFFQVVPSVLLGPLGGRILLYSQRAPMDQFGRTTKKLTLREGVQEQLSVICCKSSLNRRRAGNRTTALEAELSLVQGHQTKMAMDPPT